MTFEPLGAQSLPADDGSEPQAHSAAQNYTSPQDSQFCATAPCPVAVSLPVIEHGVQRAARFRWMREEENESALHAYLDEENSFTDRRLAHLEPLRRTLFNEFQARLPVEDTSLATQEGGYLYYERHRRDLPYSIFCRCKVGQPDSEEVFLDENELARGHPYFDIDAFAVSPDGHYVAYTVDYSGDQHYKLYIKDLTSGETLKESIKDVDEIEWNTDSNCLVYTRKDKQHRTCSLHLHILGESPKQDRLLLTEPDPAFDLEMSLARDDRHILIESGSLTSAECYLLDRKHPENGPLVVFPKSVRATCDIDSCNGRVFALTNLNALNNRVLIAETLTDQLSEYRDLLAPDPGILREAMLAFDHHLVTVARKDGVRGLEIVDLRDGDYKWVRFADSSYSLEVIADENNQSSAKQIIVHFGSYVIPDTILAVNLESGEISTHTEPEYELGFNPSLYSSKIIHAPALDKTDIPISLFYRNDLINAEVPGPVFMLGYGCYGDAYDPDPMLRKYLLSLMDRGVTVAIAHVRGGSELGMQWYEAARLLNRKTSIEDYIACAEHLVDQGITSQDKLAGYGRSAGGMLIGACANMRPDLFRVLFAQVPFVDVVTTMSNPDISLTMRERDLMGDPSEPEYYHYMLSYSPTDNVRNQSYPDIYIHSGHNDPWVAVSEPAVWTAALRTVDTKGAEIYLRTYRHEGHRGASARPELLEEWAEGLAFVLHKLGINE